MNTNNWIDARVCPPCGTKVIACTIRRCVCVAYQSANGLWFDDSHHRIDEIIYWQHLPEPPPKPDAFEEFCESRRVHRPSKVVTVGEVTMTTEEFRPIWEAVTKAAKEGK